MKNDRIKQLKIEIETELLMNNIKLGMYKKRIQCGEVLSKHDQKIRTTIRKKNRLYKKLLSDMERFGV